MSWKFCVRWGPLVNVTYWFLKKKKEITRRSMLKSWSPMLASVDPRNFNLIFLNRFLPHHQRKQSAWTVWRTGKNQSIIPVKFHNTAERFSNKIKCKLYTPIPDRAIFNHRVKVWANFAESLYILLSVLFLKEKLWISWFQTKILKNCILILFSCPTTNFCNCVVLFE